jgi:integrase
MNGTTYKRSKGNWAYSLYLGRDADGRQRRVFASGFATKREADEARRAKILEIEDQAAFQAGAPATFGQLLMIFMETAAARCSPKTLERYKSLVEYLHPDVLATALGQVNTLQLEREFERLRQAGGHHRRTKEARPLSARTVRSVWGVVSAAFNNGVRLGYLRTNPAANCHLPPMERREKATLSPTGVDFLLSAVKGTQLHPLILLAAATGARRGELLALTWSDFDPARRSLRFDKSLEQTRAGLRIKPTKTDRPRQVKLPALACEALEAHRKAQREDQAAFGQGYMSDPHLIFAAPDGSHLRPDTVTADVCRIAGQAGLKGISLHSLRHSHGSQLLSAGVPLPAVSKRLGHSTPRVTAEIYSHALPEDEEAAAGVWETLMRPHLDPPKKTQ